MNKIYEYKGFNIYNLGNNQYIVHNTNITDVFAHSHIRNYNTAKFVIKLTVSKTIRGDIPTYLMGSIIRLTSDERFKEEYQNVMNNKLRKKKDFYYNSNKGIRK